MTKKELAARLVEISKSGKTPESESGPPLKWEDLKGKIDPRSWGDHSITFRPSDSGKETPGSTRCFRFEILLHRSFTKKSAYRSEITTAFEKLLDLLSEVSPGL